MLFSFDLSYTLSSYCKLPDRSYVKKGNNLSESYAHFMWSVLYLKVLCLDWQCLKVLRSFSGLLSLSCFRFVSWRGFVMSLVQRNKQEIRWHCGLLGELGPTWRSKEKGSDSQGEWKDIGCWIAMIKGMIKLILSARYSSTQVTCINSYNTHSRVDTVIFSILHTRKLRHREVK